MKGKIVNIDSGGVKTILAIETEDQGLIAVSVLKTDAYSVGEEAEFKELEHIGSTPKGTPLFSVPTSTVTLVDGTKNEVNVKKVSDFAYCVAACELILVNLLDKKEDEVRMLILAKAVQNLRRDIDENEEDN